MDHNIETLVHNTILAEMADLPHMRKLRKTRMTHYTGGYFWGKLSLAVV